MVRKTRRTLMRVGECLRDKVLPRPPHPHEIDLGLSDAFGKFAQLFARLPPAISFAKLSTSAIRTGSDSTGERSPCRNAFFAARVLPAAVRGPVLDRALAQFAARLRSLIIMSAIGAEPALL